MIDFGMAFNTFFDIYFPRVFQAFERFPSVEWPYFYHDDVITSPNNYPLHHLSSFFPVVLISAPSYLVSSDDVNYRQLWTSPQKISNLKMFPFENHFERLHMLFCWWHWQLLKINESKRYLNQTQKITEA